VIEDLHRRVGRLIEESVINCLHFFTTIREYEHIFEFWVLSDFFRQKPFPARCRYGMVKKNTIFL
jgi:hypothetical protein